MPTDAASAREHLDEEAETSLVVRLPMPAVDVNLLGELVRAADIEQHIDAAGRVHLTTPRVAVTAPLSGSGGERRIEHSLDLSPEMLGTAAGMLQGITLAEVNLGLEVTNTSAVPVDLGSVRLSLVDAGGRVLRDAGGQPYELAIAGALAGARLAPGASVSAAAVATGMGNEILGRIATGPVRLRIAAAVGAPGTAPLQLAARVSLDAPLELLLPAAGYATDYRAHSLDAGALLQAAAALQVANRPARLELAIQNGAAFGADVTIALAPTPADTAGFDAFSAPGRVVLQQVRIEPASANPSRTRSSVALTQAALAGFAGRDVTAAVRIRLLPDASGRLHLDADDRLRIEPVAVIGGSQ